MTAAGIIQAAKAEGLIVTLSPGGSIKAIGEQSAVNRWRPTLKEHKAEIINLLTRQPGGMQPTRPAFPEWCNPHCESFHRLELPGLDMVQGCYQETNSTHWRWSRLDKMKNCPNKEQ